MSQKSVLTVAKSQIGVKESPPDSNHVKYNTWYYGKSVSGAAYPWCAVFIAWCFNQVGILKNISGVSNKAYCPSYVSWAKKANRWHVKPKVGALALFDWDHDGVADHIGIVEKVVDSRTVITIEGNTAVGNNSNGGQVMRRTRSTGYILGYVYVTIYPESKTSSSNKTKTAKIYRTGVVIAKLLNVRDRATTKGNVVRTIKKGAKVNCYASHNTNGVHWWKISPTKSEWVSTEYIGDKKVVK